MESETYKNIDSHIGLYQISDFGNVKSLSNCKSRKEKILKLTKTDSGYLRVCLTKNGNQKIYPVSRLVALSFIKNPYNKLEVNHINGIKTDNRLENLEWNTRSENMKHAFDNELKIPIVGEKHYKSKLTEVQVLEIRKSNLSQYKLGELYGVRQDTISMIKSKKSWKHIKN